MKIVIDIPDNEYKQNRYYYDNVYHCTPLKDVIEEYVERGAITENMIMLDKIELIKAEINGLSGFYSQVTGISEMNTVRNIISDVNNIIDKHIRGEE